MTNFSLPAILVCISFYSSLYLIYYYFAQQQQHFLLIIAVILFILSFILIPSADQQSKRRTFNNTFHYENFFTYPLFTWWRLFSMPIRFILSKIFN